MNGNKPMFKMLFRRDSYTLDEVLKAAQKNPDVLWVVYETNHGGMDNNPRPDRSATMSGSAITEKYG